MKSQKRRIRLASKKSGFRAMLSGGNFFKLILPKIATMFINLVSIGPRVILRSAFQILRTNIWTWLISTAIIVVFDLYNFFRKKISKRQLIINLILSASLLIGGSAGWVFGTNSVAAIVAENTVIWIIAGIIGAGVFSSVFDLVSRRVLGKFIKTDVEAMLDVINAEFEEMAAECGLDEEQTQSIANEVHVDEKVCVNCFCKSDKRRYVREFLAPYFPNEKLAGKS